MDLFYVSEDAGIREFVPRMPPSPDSKVDFPVVWAVDGEHLRNYLLPRDCPRVTFYATEKSLAEDVRYLMGPGASRAVVAIESAWLERVRAAQLYLYRMPDEGFELWDAGAGYWVSRKAVKGLEAVKVTDCLGAIAERGVELRVVKTLWPLRDAVVGSTLGFSCIRMRNARPREG